MDLSIADLRTVQGGMIIVAIIVQVSKPFIPERVIQLYALGVGVLLSIGATFAMGLVSLQEVSNGALIGFLAAASAIGLYKIQKGIGVLQPKK